MFIPPNEEFSGSGTHNGMSSSPETGRMHFQTGDQDSPLQHQNHLHQSQLQQEFKNHRNARKIDGPVIPTEYSDPDLQRQSSEFSAILQQATSNVSAKRQESTFVMDISPSVVGWIIGRSGIRIKEIQSYTGCKMWVDQDVPNDQPRKIYFHGNKQNIDAAVGRVNELVQSAPILSSNHVVSGKGLTSVIVDCPVSLVGLLIGKRGWTIKKIQQASNAQISINQSVREGLPRKIIVSGDEQSVSTALKLITEVLRDKTLLGSNGGGDHEGMHQLSMRTVNGNGYSPHDMSNGYDQGQQHHSLEMEHLNSRDVDHFNASSHVQQSGRPYHPSHNYHGHHNHHQNQGHGQGGYQHMQGQGYQGQAKRGGYSSNHLNHDHYQQHRHHHNQQHHGQYGHQESASRYFLNQNGPHHQQQLQQALPIPVRHNNYPTSGGNVHYGDSYAGHQYGGEQQHQSTSGPDHNDKFQREESPNTVEAAGGSFSYNSSSSIFDFQHRHSPVEQQHEGGEMPN